MTVTFESMVVETAPFIDRFVISFVKTFIVIIAIYFTVLILLRCFKYKENNATSLVHLMFDLCLMAIISGFKFSLTWNMVKYIFFFDFSLGKFIMHIPQQMSLSLLFTGALAMYELVISMVQIIQFCRELANTLCSPSEQK